MLRLLCPQTVKLSRRAGPATRRLPAQSATVASAGPESNRAVNVPSSGASCSRVVRPAPSRPRQTRSEGCHGSAASRVASSSVRGVGASDGCRYHGHGGHHSLSQLEARETACAYVSAHA